MSTCTGCGVGTFGPLCAICKGEQPQTEAWRQRRDRYRNGVTLASSRLPRG